MESTVDYGLLSLLNYIKMPPESERHSNPPPSLILHQLGVGYWISQALYVVAKLGVADHLDSQPRPVDMIARAVDADPHALYRVLRALASCKIFAEPTARHFTLTPIGEYLRSDTPGSLRALAMTMELDWQSWGQMLYSVKTGRCAFTKVHGESFFQHLQLHPEKAQIFDKAMTGFVSTHGVAVADAYAFPAHGKIIDIGGGHGALMRAILHSHPYTSGIIFDLPGVIEGAEQSIKLVGLSERCDCVAGDFFVSVPAGGDIYILGSVLHDWDDEHSLMILKNCRNAMSESAKLLLIEMLIPPGDEPFFGKLLDLQMLVSFGGQERTEKEYRDLLKAAGFDLTNIIPTQALPSVLEAAPISLTTISL